MSLKNVSSQDSCSLKVQKAKNTAGYIEKELVQQALFGHTGSIDFKINMDQGGIGHSRVIIDKAL